MNYLLCAHRLVHGGQDTGGGLRPLVAKSRRPSALAALPFRRHRIIGSAFPLRLSAYRWSPDEFLQRGEVGAPHYSFAMPLGCRSPPRAPIGRLRRPAILHYASWAGVLPVSQRGPLTLR